MVHQEPKKSPPSTSLKGMYGREILRWSVFGILGSFVFAGSILVYLAASSCNDQLRSAAESAAQAFRPVIISGGNAGDAERQIAEAMKLGPGETVVVRDTDFHRIRVQSRITPINDIPACSVPETICWNLRALRVSTLIPLYFDSESKNLYGFLEIVVRPKIDWKTLIVFSLALCIGAVIQILGLSSRLIKIAESVGLQLSTWAEHIKHNPKGRVQAMENPVKELYPMLEALQGLNQEITKLEDEAKDSAKISVIRGISHDILTPVSQLQKHVALLRFRQRGQKLDQEILEVMTGLDRSLRRIVALAKQTRYFHSAAELPPDAPRSCEVVKFTRQFVSDLNHDPVIAKKSLIIGCDLPECEIVAGITLTK